MAQEGYNQIPVTIEAWQKLKQRKLNRQAIEGKDITWDKFLLEATKNNGQ